MKKWKVKKSSRYFQPHRNYTGTKRATPPKGTIVIANAETENCKRCGHPMQVRMHERITDRELKKSYYFTRWFYCTTPGCDADIIHQERFKVINPRITPLG